MLGLCLKYDLKTLFRVTWPVYVVSMVLPIGIRIFYWIQDWPIFDTMIFQMFSGFYAIIYIMSLFCLIIHPLLFPLPGGNVFPHTISGNPRIFSLPPCGGSPLHPRSGHTRPDNSTSAGT